MRYQIQWTPALSDGQLREVIHAHRQQYSTRSVGSAVPLESIDASLQLPGNTYDVNARDGKGLMPRRLWRYLLEKAQIDPATQWAQLTQRDTSNLLGQLRHTVLRVSGRGSYRDEFVTCGGVPLTEIDLKSMHSTVIPGLYLCGEVIDIDGITGNV
jgi:predicted flavoprotein YhiN